MSAIPGSRPCSTLLPRFHRVVEAPVRADDQAVRFAWTWALAGLVVPLVMIAAYFWLRRRRRKYAVTYASLSLVRQALPERSWWRRIVPGALLLAAITSLVVAMARPQAVLAVSRSDTSIMLAIDVSPSMCSTDVSPNRLVAAEAAARRFVNDQPGGTRFGLVAFAGSAQILVLPTSDRGHLLDAIDALTTGISTAIGDGVLASVDALARVNPEIAPSTVKLTPAEVRETRSAGKYAPDVVVLLTDGSSNAGVDPMDAARQAAGRRVRVYTIGFGTTRPTPLACTAQQFAGETLGPPRGGLHLGGGGGASPRRGNDLAIDEVTLRSIARITGGTYARAASAPQLERAFRDLPMRIYTVKEVHELTVYLVAVSALLAVGAMATSRWWNRFS
jgi:Ca-activated chloride channel homolog